MTHRADEVARHPRSRRAGARWLRRCLLGSGSGLLILLAVCLPLSIWRSRLEASLWIDEIFSLMLAARPLAELIQLTAADAHPPGFYLLLRHWLALGEPILGAPGLAWARSVNLVPFLGMVAAGWFGGSRLLGPARGAIFCWSVAIGAAAALHIRDLRSYGLASAAIFVCFISLALIARHAGKDGSGPSHGAWLLYALAASVALWSHLLSSICLLVLVASWCALCVRPSNHRAARRLAISAAVWNLLVLASFLPWLVRVPQQLGFLATSKPAWMTPPSFENLAYVFTFWLPLARLGDPQAPGNRLLLLLGASTLAVPVVVFLLQVARRRAAGLEERLALWALSTVLAFTMISWALHRLGVSYTFHGPRYPLLAAPLWASGIAAAALSVTRRCRRPSVAALVVLAPWFLASILGQLALARREQTGGLPANRAFLTAALSEPRAPLWVIPQELAPYFGRTLSAFDVQPGRSLPCARAARDEQLVLSLNPWLGVERTRDQMLRFLIHSKTIASKVQREPLPVAGDWFEIDRLADLDRRAMATICASGLASKAERTLAGMPALALSEAQLDGRYWSFLEIGRDLETHRWATSRRAPIRFEGRLTPGRYTLHVAGYRSPYPQPVETMRFDLAGNDFDVAVEVGSGAFELSFPVPVERTIERPVVHAEHPRWSPAAAGSADDARVLSFALAAAWFERSAPPD